MEYIGELLKFGLTATVLFLQIIYWMVIIEVILSWLVLFGIQIYLQPLVAITRPIYATIKKYIPTTIGMVEFAPIIAIIGINILVSVISRVVIPYVSRIF